MGEALLLAAALLANGIGLAWLALSLDSHWRQVRGSALPSRASVTLLRWLGGGALLVSLALCLAADHPSMAVLVWVMALAVAALGVTFTFSWRPALFQPLVAWIRLPRQSSAAG